MDGWRGVAVVAGVFGVMSGVPLFVSIRPSDFVEWVAFLVGVGGVMSATSLYAAWRMRLGPFRDQD